MEIDDKVKEYVEYLYSMLSVYTEEEDKKEIRHILFKTFKSFYRETKNID